MNSLEPNFELGDLRVRISVGEILFPLLVFFFCAAYYFDTRNLPDQSMLYASPLLYVTVAMAVVTVVGQAVSVERTGVNGEGIENNGIGSMTNWGGEIESDGQVTALTFAFLIVSYVVSLYFVSFIITTPLFLALSLYVLGERSITRVLAYSVGFTFVVWLVFVEWLLVPLP
jgi:hypothetical protein